MHMAFLYYQKSFPIYYLFYKLMCLSFLQVCSEEVSLMLILHLCLSPSGIMFMKCSRFAALEKPGQESISVQVQLRAETFPGVHNMQLLENGLFQWRRSFHFGQALLLSLCIKLDLVFIVLTVFHVVSLL